MRKKTLYISFVITFCTYCIFMTSCSSEDDSFSNSITSIVATVANGSAFDSRIDKVVVYTQDDYQVATAAYENGRFVINLPKIVENSHLRKVYTYQPNLQVSNSNALGIGVRLYAYQSENRVGEFFYAKNTGIPTEALFVYVDRDVRITGKHSIERWPPNPHQSAISHINDHDISLKKGWNIIYFNETSTQQDQHLIPTEVITTRTPEELKWHFNGPGERTFQPKNFEPSFPLPNTMRVQRPIRIF